MRAGLCIVAALLALAVAGLDAPARAQMESREGIALQNQILELRNELQLLRNDLAAGGASNLGTRNPPPAPAEGAGPPNDMIAQLLNRVAGLEDQVRRLTGRVDELGNQVVRQGQLLDKAIGDLNFRLQTLEGGPGRSAGAPPPPPPGPSLSPPPSSLGALPLLPPPVPMRQPANPESGGEPAGPLPLLPPPEPPESEPHAPAQPRAQAHTPEAALREGEAALARHDYAAAGAAAREVLASRHATLGADAQFLLAEALAGQHDFPQAALAYDDTYKRARSGPRAQEALLGMARALAKIGAKPAACATLDKLRSEFLTQRAAIREAAAALRQHEACRS